MRKLQMMGNGSLSCFRRFVGGVLLHSETVCCWLMSSAKSSAQSFSFAILLFLHDPRVFLPGPLLLFYRLSELLPLSLCFFLRLLSSLLPLSLPLSSLLLFKHLLLATVDEFLHWPEVGVYRRFLYSCMTSTIMHRGLSLANMLMPGAWVYRSSFGGQGGSSFEARRLCRSASPLSGFFLLPTNFLSLESDSFVLFPAKLLLLSTGALHVFDRVKAKT